MTSQAGELNPKYEAQDAYGKSNSAYGNGVYPPDWGDRCSIIWNRQSSKNGERWCARCKVPVSENTAEVHHLIPLSEGGGNSLDNLVGLCLPCHALMHPDIAVESDMNGSIGDARIYPDSDCDERVAVIRKPRPGDSLRRNDPSTVSDLEEIEKRTQVGENQLATSRMTYHTSVEVAQRAGLGPNEREILLDELDSPSESGDSFEVRVRPLRNKFRSEFPISSGDLQVKTDANDINTYKKVKSIHTDYFFQLSKDATYASVKFVDVDRREYDRQFSNLKQGRVIKDQFYVPAPSLSPATFSTYVKIGARNWKNFIPIGALSAVGLLLFSPGGNLNLIFISFLFLTVFLSIMLSTTYHVAKSPSDNR